MSSGKPAKGKFINAFQSIQMISDYVEAEGPKEVPKVETKVISSSEQVVTQDIQPTFNLVNPPPPPILAQFPPPFLLPGAPPPPPFIPISTQPITGGESQPAIPVNTSNLQNEIDKFVSEANSIKPLENGDELYNPLEDMDEGSDMDESQMIISNSPSTSTQLDNSFDMRVAQHQSPIYPHTNTIELPSTFELPTSFNSPSSSDGESEEGNGIERISEPEVNDEQVSEIKEGFGNKLETDKEFQEEINVGFYPESIDKYESDIIVKQATKNEAINVENEMQVVEPKSNIYDISENEISDNDEEVSKQIEMTRKEMSDAPKGMELPSTQVDFIDDNDELLGTALAELEQEEKEAEEELKKELTKIKGAIKKAKKKKKKKNKNKENDKKDKDEKKKKKKKKKKLKEKEKEKEKEKGDESAKKKKKKSDKKSKEGKHTEISISSVIKEINKEAKERKLEAKKSKHTKVVKQEEDVSISKSVSKEKKKEERHHKSYDKKQDRKLYDRSNSSSARVKDKKISKDKKPLKEGKENKDRHNRKRHSRDSSLDEVRHKRSRKHHSPERHKKRSHKEERSKERRRKRSLRDESPEEKERRRSHVTDVRKNVPVKDRSPHSPKEVDYRIRLPSRERLHDLRKVKEETPPKLSKEEFYEIQSKVRKLRGGAEENRKHHIDEVRKIRDIHEEHRKHRDNIDDSHKSHRDAIDDSRKHRTSHEDLRKHDTLVDSRRIRENLEEIRSFREKMNDSRKLRDTLEDRKLLRDNLILDRKLYNSNIEENHDDIEESQKDHGDIDDLGRNKENLDEVWKVHEDLDGSQNVHRDYDDRSKHSANDEEIRKNSDSINGSRKHRDEADGFRKVLVETQKHNTVPQKSYDSKDVRKRNSLSNSSKESSESENDNKLSRSSLRENYSKELDRYRREHERGLKVSNDLKNKHIHKGKSRFMSPELIELHTSNFPKSPVSPPPPPPRKRSESIKSNSSSINQSTSYKQSRTFSSEDDTAPLNLEILGNDRGEDASMFDNGKPIVERVSDDDDGKLEIDQHQLSRSPSLGEESVDNLSPEETKPGFVSLRQYKQRKKTGLKPNVKVHRRRSSFSSLDEKEFKDIEHLNKQTREGDLPEANNETSQEDSGSPVLQEHKENGLDVFITHENDANESEEDKVLESKEEKEFLSSSIQPVFEAKSPISSEENALNDSSIPVYSDEARQHSSEKLESTWKDHPELSDAEKVDSPVDDDSPYNPEFASPFDIGSPQLDDSGDQHIDFRAYKNVVAFDDIMKSKIKQQARKQKRRRLEEMKFQLDGRGGSKRERKLVDHLIRQARVEEEMKNVLKQYFKSRDITKEEYKTILKKAVPQVTMSNSAIIPEKIHSLMVKFVRKCKGQRMREDKSRQKHQFELAEQQKELQLQLQANAAMLENFQPFQQMRVLNPNLPLPPL